MFMEYLVDGDSYSPIGRIYRNGTETDCSRPELTELATICVMCNDAAIYYNQVSFLASRMALSSFNRLCRYVMFFALRSFTHTRRSARRRKRRCWYWQVSLVSCGRVVWFMHFHSFRPLPLEKMNVYRTMKAYVQASDLGSLCGRVIKSQWQRVSSFEFSHDRKSMSAFCVPSNSPNGAPRAFVKVRGLVLLYNSPRE